MPFAMIAFVLIGSWAWYCGPSLMLDEGQFSGVKDAALERAKLEQQYRASIAHAMLGIGVFLGIYLTWRRIRAAEKQGAVAEDGQITERFTKAIEQLGSDSGTIRLGGIFALERIARDSPRDHWTIMEVLTGFVRERASAPVTGFIASDAPDPCTEEGGEEIPVPPSDIQAVLTVIGRRGNRDDEPAGLDLRATQLAKSYLGHLNLDRAILSEAHLQEAYLGRTHLKGAVLRRIHLEGADADEAHLEGADLRKSFVRGASLMRAHLEEALCAEAHMENACFAGAHMEGASLIAARLERAIFHSADLRRVDFRASFLEDAQFEGAHLEGANLAGANGLTQEQVDSAILDVMTELPAGINWSGGDRESG